MKFKIAQGWGIDLIIGITIFLTGILTFYLLSLNSYDETKDIIKSLSYEGQVVSDSLLSEGFPENWNTSNVVKIGLTSNNKLDEFKLEQFYFLSKSDYKLTKILLNTNNEYYFSISEPMLINGTLVNEIGLKNSSMSNLIKTTRFTIYKDKPVTMNLNIWN